jgi:hypothetical protein
VDERKKSEMKFKKVLIVTGILLGVLIFMGGALAVSKEEYRQNFSVAPGTVLKVYNRNGAINVSSWDRDYIEVVAVKKLHWWDRFLKEPRIDIATGKEFVVRTLYDSAVCEAIPIYYRITVPKGMLVKHVETSTGEINLDQVTGSVKAVTSTGKIHADQVTGDVDAKTSTGDIQIRKVAGFVKAITSMGSIDIAGIGGLYGASTKTGKISAEVPALRDNLEIKSSTGSITVFLSPDIAGELEASTSNGQITYIELPLKVSEASKTKLSGRLGEGASARDNKIFIKTSTGAITLKKLSNWQN